MRVQPLNGLDSPQPRKKKKHSGTTREGEEDVLLNQRDRPGESWPAVPFTFTSSGLEHRDDTPRVSSIFLCLFTRGTRYRAARTQRHDNCRARIIRSLGTRPCTDLLPGLVLAKEATRLALFLHLLSVDLRVITERNEKHTAKSNSLAGNALHLQAAHAKLFLFFETCHKI